MLCPVTPRQKEALSLAHRGLPIDLIAKRLRLSRESAYDLLRRAKIRFGTWTAKESPWTDQKIVRLQALWHEGLSTAEIGRRLEVPKNAVIGKAHREGLPPRPSPIRR